jgi:hypothetical protein
MSIVQLFLVARMNTSYEKKLSGWRRTHLKRYFYLSLVCFEENRKKDDSLARVQVKRSIRTASLFRKRQYQQTVLFIQSIVFRSFSIHFLPSEILYWLWYYASNKILSSCYNRCLFLMFSCIEKRICMNIYTVICADKWICHSVFFRTSDKLAQKDSYLYRTAIYLAAGIWTKFLSHIVLTP